MASGTVEELEIVSGGKRIYGTLHVPASGAPAHPLVIMSHGFGGMHHPQDPLAERLAGEGFLVYGFDFCGGGPMSRSSGTTTEMSVLTEAADLNMVMDDLMERGDVDRSRVVLIGTSQGGFVSAYLAAQRPADVAAMVLFFPAFVIQDDARRTAEEHGGIPERYEVMGVALGGIYAQDALSFDIYEHIGAYSGPVRIVHGDADQLVPLAYSERAVGCYPNAELVVMPGQGHGFRNGGGPEAAQLTSEFLAPLQRF